MFIQPFLPIQWTEKSNDLQIHNHIAARDPDSLRNFKDYLRSYKELKKIHWYTCKEDPTKITAKISVSKAMVLSL